MLNLRFVRCFLFVLSLVVIGISIIPGNYGFTYVADVDAPCVEATDPSVVIDPTDVVLPVDVPNTAPVEPTDIVISTPTEPVETAHTHVYDVSFVSPGCETQGYTVHTCLCGDEYTDDYVPATGHIWSDWVIIREATTLSEGEQSKSCSQCGFVLTESIPVIEIFVPSGSNISFNAGFANISPETAVSDLTVCPSESDFSEFYGQALEIYNALLGSDESVTVYLSRDVIGDIDAMTASEIEAAMKSVLDDFVDKFNRLVLQDYCNLRIPKASYYAGMICVDLDATRSDITNIIIEDSVYTRANVSAGLYDGMSERDAVGAINKWICNHMCYSDGYVSPADALNVGYGNCSSYAVLFYAMCDDAGIDCRVVSGTVIQDGVESGHAWNRVQIGGSWYYIDTCWNDFSPANRYMLTDVIWEDHVVGSIDTPYY